VGAGGRAQDHRVAADGIDRVVIAVLVGHEQQLGLDAGDRRIVPADATASEHRGVEGIDEDGVLAVGQPEGGLAIPLNVHAAPRG
jgi:hypothetical protein